MPVYLRSKYPKQKDAMEIERHGEVKEVIGVSGRACWREREEQRGQARERNKEKRGREQEDTEKGLKGQGKAHTRLLL